MFYDIRVRLSALLEKQITEFRYYFPFGRPEGALKQTLGLLERVSLLIFQCHSMFNAFSHPGKITSCVTVAWFIVLSVLISLLKANPARTQISSPPRFCSRSIFESTNQCHRVAHNLCSNLFTAMMYVGSLLKLDCSLK